MTDIASCTRLYCKLTMLHTGGWSSRDWERVKNSIQKSSCRRAAFGQVQLDVGESGIAATAVLHLVRRQVKFPPATLDLKKTRGRAECQELPRVCSKKTADTTDFFIKTPHKVIDGGVLLF